MTLLYIICIGTVKLYVILFCNVEGAACIKVDIVIGFCWELDLFDGLSLYISY